MVREMCGVQLKDGKRSMAREMCGVQLKDKKGAKDLMFMLGLNETIKSVDCGKQCSLVWSCVEEPGWSCLEMGMRLKVIIHD